jgi:hypothetical protein
VVPSDFGCGENILAQCIHLCATWGTPGCYSRQALACVLCCGAVTASRMRHVASCSIPVSLPGR